MGLGILAHAFALGAQHEGDRIESLNVSNAAAIALYAAVTTGS